MKRKKTGIDRTDPWARKERRKSSVNILHEETAYENESDFKERNVLGENSCQG